MSRGDVSVGLLVSIAALMAFLVVTLVIVWPVLKDALFGAGEEGQCQFSLLLSTKLKGLTFGAADLPAECTMIRKTVTLADLQKYVPAARALREKERAEAVAENPELFAELGESSPAVYDFLDNFWALKKVIAEEMVGCMSKGWKGKLDLQGSAGIASQIKEAVKAGLAVDGPQNLACLACSRLTFDQNVIQMMENPPLGEKITSVRMEYWLKSSSYKDETYYAELTDEVDEFYHGLLDYDIVLRERPTVLFVGDIYGKGGLVVAPYDKLTTDLGFNYRENSALGTRGGRAKCISIIGD